MTFTNLISDTVTKPDNNMLEAMMIAEVGDDVFGEDPTVNRLESIMAGMFNKEAALFCPSGTMTNQIAIKINTQPLDEMICDCDAHVYQSETGGYAFHSGIAVNLIQGTHGLITAQQIEKAVKPGHDWQPISRLVVLENSTNKGGGSYYTLNNIRDIYTQCQKLGLKLHLDGARLFNVLVETQESTTSYGSYFDTISICLSKGLGAPIGSVLIGTHEAIRKARRLRKVMGGGMRQVGYLAAAGIYALENNIPLLKKDNQRAKIISQVLETKNFVQEIKPVKTNIIIFTLIPTIKDIDFIEKLRNVGILAAPFGENTIRFVFHKDITEDQFEILVHTLKNKL